MDLEELAGLVEEDIASRYSKAVIEHATNPRNMRCLPGASGHSRITGPCGDTMEMWIRVSGGRIQEATFQTSGCGTTVACGSIATELVKDKTLEEALGLGHEEVLRALEGLPEESVHCAFLAAWTLREAVRDCLSRQAEE